MTTNQQVINNYLNLRNELKKLECENETIKLDCFMHSAKNLFEEYPNLISFGWKQFTPSFNDGDPCYFRANIDEPDINGVGWYDATEEEWEANEQMAANITEFLGDYESELENIFGDNNAITITKEGIQKKHYRPY